LPVDDDRRWRWRFLHDDLLWFWSFLPNHDGLRCWFGRSIVFGLLSVALDLPIVMVMVMVVVVVSLDAFLDFHIIDMIVGSALDALLDSHVVKMVAVLLGSTFDPLFYSNIVAIIPGHA
jgi:hypothetical protein